MSGAPVGWQNPKTDWSASNVPLHTDFNRIEGNSNAIESGERTLDPAQAPSGNVGSLRQLLDWLANRLKAITGATNWYDAPAKTLAQLWALFHASTGHKHSGAAGDAPNVPWANVSSKPSSYAPDAHAISHKTGGTDKLTPADIGAAPSPVGLSDIASAAKTSEGGTEAKRLALTDANGRVGAAKVTDTLGGLTAIQVAHAKPVCTFTEADQYIDGFVVVGDFAYYMDRSKHFNKVNLSTGAVTGLAAGPADMESLMDLFKCGTASIGLLYWKSGGGTFFRAYNIDTNTWGNEVTICATGAGAGRGVWDGGSYVYIVANDAAKYTCLYRLTLANSTVTELKNFQPSSSNNYSPITICLVSGHIYFGTVYSDYSYWKSYRISDGNFIDAKTPWSGQDMRGRSDQGNRAIIYNGSSGYVGYYHFTAQSLNTLPAWASNTSTMCIEDGKWYWLVSFAEHDTVKRQVAMFPLTQ